MAGVEQNRYKTKNVCIKHLPQTGYQYPVRIRNATKTGVVFYPNCFKKFDQHCVNTRTGCVFEAIAR